MAIKIDIKHDSPIGLIKDEPTANPPAPMQIRLYLDLWEAPAKITADTWSALYGTPEMERNGHIQSWRLPDGVDATKLRDWVETEIVSLAERIAAGYILEWNDGKYDSVFTDDAQEAIQDIEDLCSTDSPSPAPSIEQHEGFYAPEDWLANDTVFSLNQIGIGDSYIITADTSDARIAEMAECINDEAWLENVILGHDTESLLLMYRDMLRD
jgi:hypothetical protein